MVYYLPAFFIYSLFLLQNLHIKKMSDTEEDTPREHNEANQENKLHEKKSDTITWKYKKTIHCTTIPFIITLLLVIIILTWPFWMSFIIFENMKQTRNLVNSNCSSFFKNYV